LERLEQKPKRLREAVSALLADKPRPGLPRHLHGGAGLPDSGGRLRKAAGTPQPLDAPGTDPGSHPTGHR